MVKRTYKRKGGMRKKRAYRKRYNRRYKKSGKVQKGRVTGITTGFPEILFTKLKYAENNFDMTLAANSQATMAPMAANNPRDPFNGVGGKSALYFATYAGIYKYCRVSACKITFRLTKVADSNEGVLACIVPRYAGLTPLTEYDDIMSQPRIKYSNRTLNRIGESITLKYYLPINTIFQISKLQYRSQFPGDDYDAKINSNPNLVALLECYALRQVEGIVGAISLQGSIHMKFYCKFYQRYRYIELGTDNGQTELDANEVPLPEGLPDGAFDD